MSNVWENTDFIFGVLLLLGVVSLTIGMAPERTTIFVLLISIIVAACSSHNGPAPNLLGIRVGMERSAVESRLNGISQFVQREGANHEVWRVNDSSRFDALAVGYSDGKLRYVTAFVDKEHATDSIPFSSIGDLARAKAEIMDPHHRYVWDVPAADGNAATSIVAYGDNPDFVTIYTLVAKRDDGEPFETEEDD